MQAKENMAESGNLFAGVMSNPAAEASAVLMAASGVRIERIVSTGQASSPGFWYDQPHGEWVLLVEGGAALEFADEPEWHRMSRGDYLWIPPHRRHRVAWTDSDRATIWLAVHVGGGKP
jgi:cupin 2 domain-containing protein